MNFFKEQQGAAVIKHCVLQRYLPTFVSKTGSKSRDHRVVYVDGFAGPGAYDDGTPLDAVLAEFVEHYNGARPHRALGLDTPEPGARPASPVSASRIRPRDRLDGLIREYEVAA